MFSWIIQKYFWMPFSKESQKKKKNANVCDITERRGVFNVFSLSPFLVRGTLNKAMFVGNSYNVLPIFPKYVRYEVGAMDMKDVWNFAVKFAKALLHLAGGECKGCIRQLLSLWHSPISNVEQFVYTVSNCEDVSQIVDESNILNNLFGKQF